jgi:DNA polymerase-4
MAESFPEPIVHLDMDAFFVEVERRHDPALRGRPVLVGGRGNRSVVAAASYETRRHGVRSGMPMAHARRLVPAAVVVPPDHGRYGDASREVFGVLESFTPRVEPISVDEAFLDVGGLRLHHETAVECVGEIRRAIRERTGLPSSAGIATSKFIAKMASRDAKPDGVLLVGSGEETAFLHPKPIRDLWGVGEATHARLEELGLVTIGDIAAHPRDALTRRLGESLGTMLADLSHAIDPRPVGPEDHARSISVEETFEEDLVDREAMDLVLLAQADRLATRLRRNGVMAGTVTLKARYPDFTTVTRSHTFREPVATSAELLEAARQLLERTDAETRGVRLLGIGGAHLVDAAGLRQLDLMPGPWEEIDAAVEVIRERFGRGAVGRAALADDPPADHGNRPS